MIRKKRVTLTLLFLVASLVSSSLLSVSSVTAQNGEDEEETEEAEETTELGDVVSDTAHYEWLNTSYYRGNNQWEKFDPEGDPHPWNTDPTHQDDVYTIDDVAFVPEGYRDLPYPYGASTRVRDTGLVHEWYNASSGEWVVYDPEGGVHPENKKEDTPDYAKEWAHPWWAATRARAKGEAPEEEYPEEEAEEELSEDPWGDWVEDNMELVDTWWGSIWNWFARLFGREDYVDKNPGIQESYEGFFDPEEQP